MLSAIPVALATTATIASIMLTQTASLVPESRDMLAQSAVAFHTAARQQFAGAGAQNPAQAVAAGAFNRLAGWNSAVERDQTGDLWVLTWPSDYGSGAGRFDDRALDAMLSRLAATSDPEIVVGSWTQDQMTGSWRVGLVTFPSQPGGIPPNWGAPTLATRL